MISKRKLPHASGDDCRPLIGMRGFWMCGDVEEKHPRISHLSKMKDLCHQIILTLTHPG